ncbi:MAG: preprotein translocase subunit SecA, partial [bacterium]
MKNWIPFVDKILKFFFGSKHERDMKRLEPMVELVGLFERCVHDRSDEWLAGRTDYFRGQLADGVDRQTRKEDYRRQLREAQQRLEDLSVDEVCDNFRRRLLDNREELSEKYEGDAFQVAIESPLKDKNIDKLIDNYRRRLEKWRAQDLENLLERFDGLWDHFCENAPDEDKQLWYLIPEVYSLVRETAHRRLGLRHYDVQVLGAVVMHEGEIVEMKTGEGKTLAATMPLYLNALEGKGAHLITVNDYLARRDSRWMGEIYQKLGMSVGLIQNGMPPGDRKPQYEKDITYGTNNEFGFDYLRDNMAVQAEDIVQKEHNYAIIDEVDSVLIDEARTPLIISGQADKPVSLYRKVDRVVKSLQRKKDYEVDEKKNSVSLTDPGTDKVEEKLGLDNLFSTANMELVHHIHQAIRAHQLYEKDAEYVVMDGQVQIVDQFTGRLQPGRRFSDGLHQAIEAKEGVNIRQENQTLATVTIQNFFRMYEKLSGMTGTADTEAEEFKEIYDLDVVVVPTHEPDIRVDKEDAIYRTREEKFKAVIEEIENLHKNGKPVLVGTVDIEKSELLGRKLKKRGIPHNILNAKNHEKEAAIIAQAGQEGAVTIATNMAGRGTDIVLGDEVIEDGCPLESEEEDEKPYCPHDPICGLHVLGTERHEARRIDNQLRGRTARQGDPGASRFYVSLEDDLMRMFGSDRISGMLQSLGLEEGQRIEHPWISRSIKKAQSKVETRNFEIRKRLLEYDDVLDQQRSIIYGERRKALLQDEVSDTVELFIQTQVEDWIDYSAVPRRPAVEWPLEELVEDIDNLIGWAPPEKKLEEWKELRQEELEERLLDSVLKLYEERKEEFGEESFHQVEKQLLLRVIDTHWKEHLDAMDSLKQGIQLEGMAQKEPLVEYKRQGFDMFETLQVRIREDFLRFIFQAEVVSETPQVSGPTETSLEHEQIQGLSSLLEDDTADSQQEAVKSGSSGGDSIQKTVVKGEDVGRNDPCPCGSG